MLNKCPSTSFVSALICPEPTSILLEITDKFLKTTSAGVKDYVMAHATKH